MLQDVLRRIVELLSKNYLAWNAFSLDKRIINKVFRVVCKSINVQFYYDSLNLLVGAYLYFPDRQFCWVDSISDAGGELLIFLRQIGSHIKRCRISERLFSGLRLFRS